MSKFVPIGRQSHRDRRWKRPDHYGFASRDRVVPVVAPELRDLIGSMPLTFVQRGEIFHLAGLTGLGDRNLFVAPDGRWLDSYVPAALRSWPFRLFPSEGRMILCADEESGLLDQGEEPFFGAEGEPAETLAAVMRFLEQYERARQATDRAVASLAEQKLIMPWELEVRTGSGSVAVKGLHRIDEKSLVALSDEAFLTLRRAGGLSVAYAQMLSLKRIRHLEHLADVQKRLAAGPETPADKGSDFGWSLPEGIDLAPL